MHLSSIMSMELLESEIAAGYIRKTKHPDLDLYVLGYTDKAQFDRRWNKATMNCRGLIVDGNNNVVARSYPKFWNIQEPESIIKLDYDGPVEVTDKMDGSLIIAFLEPPVTKFNGGSPLEVQHNGFASRGSFTSDHAYEADDIWTEKYSEVELRADHTFLFELIVPRNRIVVNYGDMRDLVLLGAIENATGKIIGPDYAASLLNWPGPTAKVFKFNSVREAFEAPPRPNAEGYVIRAGNAMCKIKQADYVELHRIVTNLNKRTLWERFGAGETVESVCEKIPDELHSFVIETYEDLELRHHEIYTTALNEFIDCNDDDRKTFALKANETPYPHLLFKIYDQGENSIDADIWKMIRPPAER